MNSEQMTMKKGFAMHFLRLKRRQMGFTIIEALVAMLIMSFGLMAVSGMQMTLSQGGDISKQRTEANRLAQKKMEDLRSFTQLTTATGVISWDGLSSGSDTISTNATYTRTWTLGGASTDTYRAVSVNVSWLDRVNTTQSLTVTSVISRTDPKDIGYLAFPLPENTNLKRVKNRNLDIPVPAISLTGTNAGYSAYNVTSNLAVVFSDTNGNVVMSCPTQITASTSSLTGCTTQTAVIISGYVTDNTMGSSVSTCNGNGNGNNCTTSSSTGTTGIDYSGLTWSDGTTRSVTCAYGNATSQNDNTTISGTKYYLCVIYIANNVTWSGSLKIRGISTASTYVNCRYQYTNTALGNNGRNVQPYSAVGDSIDNQNYYVVLSASNNSATCPSITNSNQSAAATLVLHQDCRSTASNLNGNCPQ
jgi:type II secretory pathway pseudopilin PulG